MKHSEWLTTTTGDSVRNVAITIGVAPRTLATQLEKEHLSPENVIKIAEAYDALGDPAAAARAEAALKGQPFTAETFEAAAQAVGDDFQPLSDWRATAEYRQHLAANFFRRFWLEQSGAEHRLRRVE